MREVIALLLLALVGCDGCNDEYRRCEREKGVVMCHDGTPVCVAREGLRFLNIHPEHY